MSLQVAGDGLESIVEFQVQIKRNHQQENEDKWQGWQIWTNEKLAIKLTKTSCRSCYNQPSNCLTRYQSLKSKNSGKGHTRE